MIASWARIRPAERRSRCDRRGACRYFAPTGARRYTSKEIQARLIILSALVLAALFPLGILAFRIATFDRLTYSFLIWNLFLAGIPVVFAVLAEVAWRFQRRGLTIGLLVGWLAFFPNAPYITTDLVHLRERAPVPVWLDAMILTSAALAGLLAGLVSLYLVQQMAEDRFGRFWGWALCAIVITAASFGVYVGRFARFNSWDLLTAPHEIVYAVGEHVADPLTGLTALVVTVSFTGLQLVSYAIVRCLGRLTSLGAVRSASRQTSIGVGPGPWSGG